MFNNYKATLEIPNIVFEKSKAALSFHIGFELALNLFLLDYESGFPK